MGYLIDGGLLLLTLLFGILGVRTLNVRAKANNERMKRHLSLDWQDVKSPMPPATYGMTFIYLMISFTCMIALIIMITVTQ